MIKNIDIQVQVDSLMHFECVYRYDNGVDNLNITTHKQ
jgi:hypothetical protein